MAEFWEGLGVLDEPAQAGEWWEGLGKLDEAPQETNYQRMVREEQERTAQGIDPFQYNIQRGMELAGKEPGNILYRAGETTAAGIGGRVGSMLGGVAEAAAETVGAQGVADFFREQRDYARNTRQRIDAEQSLLDKQSWLPMASSAVRQGLAALGESIVALGAGGGLPGLAAYYGSSAADDSLEKGDSYAQATAHGLVEFGWTMAGGKLLGAGTGALAAGASDTIAARAANAVAKKFGIGNGLAKIAQAAGGAGAEVVEEVATEASHYLTDVGFGKEFDRKEFVDRMKSVIGLALVAGGAARGVQLLADSVQQRREQLADVAKGIADAQAYTGEPPIVPGFVRFYHGGIEQEGKRFFSPDRAYAEGYAKKNVSGDAKVFYIDLPESSPFLKKAYDDSGTDSPAPYISFEAPEELARQAKPLLTEPPPTSRRAFERVTGIKGANKTHREAFVDELNRKLQETENAETIRSPEEEVRQEPGRGDLRGEGQVEAGAVAPGESPEAQVEPVTISKRELDYLDRRVQKLRESGAVSQDALDDLDWLLSNNPTDLQDVLGEAGSRAATHNAQMNEARNEWTAAFGRDSARLVKLARRRAAGDAASIQRFDEITERVRNNPDQFPNITAAAQQLGGGDLESGLFQLAQESRKYFANKTEDDFVADVAQEAIQSRNAPQQTSEELEAEFGPFALMNTISTTDLGLKVRAFGRKLKRAAVKYGPTSWKGLDIRDADERRIGQLKYLEQRRRFLVRDLKDVMREQYGPDWNTDAVKQAVDRGLQGDTEGLPPEIVEALAPMREVIDGLGVRLVELGIPSEQAQVTIAEQHGKYVPRTYRLFRDKQYRDLVKNDTAKRTEALSGLRDLFPEESEADLNVRLERLLETGDTFDTEPIRAVGDRLKHRKDLPVWLRELFGEYHDPFINFSTAIADVGKLLAKSEETSELRELGLGAGWLSTADQKIAGHSHKMDWGNVPYMKPLNGLYTDPEIAKVIEDTLMPKHGTGIAARAYRGLVAANAFSKFQMTIGNFPTWLRNFYTVPLKMLRNGDFAALADLPRTARVVKGIMADDKQARPYIEKLARYNLIESDAYVSEMRDMIGAQADFELDRWKLTGGKVGRGVKQTLAKLGQAYQMVGDSVGKIAAWENKKRQFKKAFPNESEQQIEERAARDINDHYEFYARVPKGVKFVSQFPGMTTFVSFYSEMGRNFLNELRTIHGELKSGNPELQKLAAQRMAGTLLSLSILGAISNGLKNYFGIDDKDEEALRPFLADWNQNSQLLPLSQIESGHGAAFDASFMDPMAVYLRPLLAAVNEDGFTDRLEAAGREMFDQVAGESVVFGRLLSWYRNTDQYGRKVYTENAPLSRKARDFAAYMGEPFVPGTAKRIQRLMESDNPTVEAIAMLGFRSTEIDVPKSFFYRSLDFKRRIESTEEDMRRVMYREKNVDTLRERLAELEAARRGYFQEWHQLMQSAALVGANTTEIRARLAEAEPGQARQRMVSLGLYQPYRPGPQTVSRLRQRGLSPELLIAPARTQ